MKSVEFNRHICMKLAAFPVTMLWALVSRKRRHLHILKKRKHWENKQTVTLIFVSCLPWTRFCRSESSSSSFYSHFLEDKGSYSGKIISPNASETNIPTKVHGNKRGWSLASLMTPATLFCLQTHASISIDNIYVFRKYTE